MKKVLKFLLIIVIIALVGLVALYFITTKLAEKERTDKYAEFSWPRSEAAAQVPVPEKLYGSIDRENETDFEVTLGDQTQGDYNQYVEACMDAGFTVDYSRSSWLFSAKNEAGYDLSVTFYENLKEMSISVSASSADDGTAEDTDEETDKAVTTAKAETTQATTEKPADTTKANAAGLRPEFKKAMDSYETFMGEYVDFMKKFNANPSDLTLLAEYADYMAKYSQTTDDFDKWESEDMNDAETAYYLQVQSRVLQKLSTVS
ncbi:MAG: hypothetical protein IK080_05935 [Clostridia bacterium]|nr:hypothetical protein [Clostridia bacterium]